MAVLYGNAVVGQSGGPTAAINATLSGVIRGVQASGGVIGTLYGMRNGVEGLLSEKMVDLTRLFAEEQDLKSLELTPAAALGSCRYRLPDPDRNDAPFEQLLAVFRQYDIRYFFYIGGNDSMDAVSKLSAFMKKKEYEMRIIGVPKTIDNDLVGTDHTPGFGSAAKYIACSIKEMLRDIAVYTIPAVTIVEIMGRDAGWLTAAAALPCLTGDGPDLIYLPEKIFDMDDFLQDVRTALQKHPNVMVAVSEGVRFADGRYVGEGTQSGAADSFGHKYLAGTGKALEMAVKAEIGCKVRSVELNLPQRCASHIASLTDITESVRIGHAAVDAAVAGTSGHMMVMLRRKEEKYGIDISSKPVHEIANIVRPVPDTYITAGGNGITEEGLAFLAPLIEGECASVYRCGMPEHYILK